MLAIAPPQQQLHSARTQSRVCARKQPRIPTPGNSTALPGGHVHTPLSLWPWDHPSVRPSTHRIQLAIALPQPQRHSARTQLRTCASKQHTHSYIRQQHCTPWSACAHTPKPCALGTVLKSPAPALRLCPTASSQPGDADTSAIRLCTAMSQVWHVRKHASAAADAPIIVQSTARTPRNIPPFRDMRTPCVNRPAHCCARRRCRT